MKTIVSIISDQTIPNYLFIKELADPNDNLLFISSKGRMETKLSYLIDSLKWSSTRTFQLILNEIGDEENAVRMEEQINFYIHSHHIEGEFYINLTGGTKLMALAIQQIFEKRQSHFFYIPAPKNIILNLFETNISPQPIHYRVTVDEYLRLYGITETSHKDIVQDEIITEQFFTYFMYMFSAQDYKLLNNLRIINNGKARDKGVKSIKAENSLNELDMFLQHMNIDHEEDKLSPEIVKYLTGGWFEEYVYNHLKAELNPTDIKIGLLIQRRPEMDIKTPNDLDVIFTIGNKLYVIECKTGITKTEDDQGDVAGGLFNEIVYKAAAIRETLLGLSAKSYIAALCRPKKGLEEIAKSMNITYLDRTYFENNEKWRCVISKILIDSHETDIS